MNDKEIENEFEGIYKNQIEPNIHKLEDFRLKYAKKYNVVSRFSLFFISLGIISVIIQGVNNVIDIIPEQIIIPIFVTSVILFIILNIYKTKLLKNYKKVVKPVILEPILSIFGKLKVVNNSLLSLKEIKSTGLYYNTQNQKDDDNIYGTYNGIDIAIVETKLSHIERTGNSDDDRNEIIDFNGLILKIKMNKNFEGMTIGEQITSINNYIKIKNGKLCVDIFDQYTRNKVTKKLEKINLEDPEFNQNYNVYSDSQVEAKYLLSPTFIEKIKNIQSIFLVASVNFAFKENMIYLFLDGSTFTEYANRENKHGFFEVGDINDTLTNKDIYLKLFKELIRIFLLVDYLKLCQSND